MNRVTLNPELEGEVRGALAAARDRATRFAPELIVLFGPDHFNGVMHDMMPPFCIGAMAESIGDYGTAKGPLTVPTALAMDCASSVLDSGIDVAVSHRLRVDHGFAQPLELLTERIDRVPVLPVFINCIAAPLTSLKRIRLLGNAIGRYLARAQTDKRILIVGSGGLSHDPPIPSLETGSEAVRHRLMNGLVRTPEEQSAQEARVVEAARAFAQPGYSGSGGMSMAPLNPEWDMRILNLLCSGHPSSLDAMTNAEIVAAGGRSAQEIRTWVAAFACLAAFGPSEAHIDYYHAIPDWVAGFAIVHAESRLEHPHFAP
jgi:2,3-dihydroxyphenylpropionate 1,2-dioxygenase